MSNTNIKFSHKKNMPYSHVIHCKVFCRTFTYVYRMMTSWRGSVFWWASNSGLVYFSMSVKTIVAFPLIWDAVSHTWRHCNQFEWIALGYWCNEVQHLLYCCYIIVETVWNHGIHLVSSQWPIGAVIRKRPVLASQESSPLKSNLYRSVSYNSNNVYLIFTNSVDTVASAQFLKMQFFNAKLQKHLCAKLKESCTWGLSTNMV